TGAKAKETGPSYRLSASWRPVPSVTTYAAVATGFRAPVVNARAGSVSTIDPDDLVIPYGADSDKLINYELGMKGSWLDGRLAANLALYYVDWNDIQVQANRVSDQVQFATNIGGAYSRGLEFELMAMPNMDWTIALNGSFNRARVDELTPQEAAISGTVLGARLAAPEVSASLVTSYRFDFIRGSEGNASLAIVHVGDFPGQFQYVPRQPGVVSPVAGRARSAVRRQPDLRRHLRVCRGGRQRRRRVRPLHGGPVRGEPVRRPFGDLRASGGVPRRPLRAGAAAHRRRARGVPVLMAALPASQAMPGAQHARPGARAWIVLAILCLVYVLNFLDRQLLSILAKPIQDELGVTDSQLGLIGGLYFAMFYCILAIPVGWLADRTNRVRVL